MTFGWNTRGPETHINSYWGFCFFCAKKPHQDPTSAELDSRFLRLVSGRWPRSPAPLSGRNARRGSRTATGSLLRNVAPAPARTPALSARGISWGSSAKSVSAAGRKDPFGGDQVSAVDFFFFFLLNKYWCVLCVRMETVSPNPPPPPRPSLEQQRHYTAVKGSNLNRRRQIFSAVRKKKKNPPVPLDLLVVCRFSARHLSRTYRTRASWMYRKWSICCNVAPWVIVILLWSE